MSLGRKNINIEHKHTEPLTQRIVSETMVYNHLIIGNDVHRRIQGVYRICDVLDDPNLYDEPGKQDDDGDTVSYEEDHYENIDNYLRQNVQNDSLENQEGW